MLYFPLPFVIVKRMVGKKTKSRFFYIIINPDITLATASIAKQIVETRWLYNPDNLLRFFWSKSTFQKRFLLSHEIKVQTLSIIYGKKEYDCRTAEAWALKKRYKALFNNKSLSWVREEMAGFRRKSRKWVLKNYPLLKKYRKKVEKFRNDC